MSNVSPLSGRDAWVRHLQTRGLAAQTAAKIADTLSQENTGERVNNGEVVEEGGVLVDLTDGLSEEETTALGLRAERTGDRYIRQGWAADGEAGVETEEQGAKVTETDELERAYASIARYADAHGISYEQAQRIYFQADISFTRQSLSEVKEQREATRSSWVSEYNTQKAGNPDLTFIDWVKGKFGITDEHDPVLHNLQAYLETHADTTPEQLVDYLLLNGFAARFSAAIQTDPAEGDNPGLGLSQAIIGRTAPADYQVAALEPFYKNAPAAETPEGATEQAEASDPPAESVQTADEAFYNIEVARQTAENADRLLTRENPNLTRVLELYREAQSQIENLSSDPEAAELYAHISGKIRDLENGFGSVAGADGDEIWTFDVPAVQAPAPSGLPAGQAGAGQAAAELPAGTPAAQAPDEPAPAAAPAAPVVAEPSPENPVDITQDIAALQAPATPVESPEPEIVPEPAVEPVIVAEAAPPPDTQIQELRSQAHRAYEDLKAFADENGLTNSDMHGNLRWAETQLARVASTDDAQEIQKFIDALPGARTLAEGVVARRETREQAGTTAAAGTNTAPARTRGNLGDIPTMQAVLANPRINPARAGAVLVGHWQHLADKFQGIANGAARRNVQVVTISGYLEFNPTTGEVRWAEVNIEPSEYLTLQLDLNEDGSLEEVNLWEALGSRASAQRFTSNPGFTADPQHYQDMGGGWYRFRQRLSTTGQPN